MMRDILREKFDPNNENLDLLCIDYNVNDPEFATICETIMDSMLAGEWHKGMFRELEGECAKDSFIPAFDCEGI